MRAYTVVVLGGHQPDETCSECRQDTVQSVLVLNVAEPSDKKWREGPRLNKGRQLSRCATEAITSWEDTTRKVCPVWIEWNPWMQMIF